MFPWTDPAEPLRCDRFMAAALHHPDHGYYARRIRGVGRTSDFTTAAALSPGLGRAVADWAATALRETGCRDLIELGPGGGTLAAAVRARLPRLRRITLHLVESSEPLRGIQRRLLGRRVRWHGSASAALDACGGRACLYSNEFVDAFPVRRFRRQDGRWQELHLLPGRELWLEPDPRPVSSAFDREWPDGQIIEVNESHREWLAGVLPYWRSGSMLTIDYGAEVDRLHHRQPLGSLRAYLHHQRLSGPEVYANPGRQDLTADVNFTDLQRIPGLVTRRLITQREFLLRHLDPRDPADRHAADPHGAGSAFLVLEQEPALGES